MIWILFTALLGLTWAGYVAYKIYVEDVKDTPDDEIRNF